MKSTTKRKLYLLGLLFFAALFLTGCVSYTETGEPTGFIYQYLGLPTARLLDWLANLFSGSYGIAIIIITIITRLLMMPSSIRMTRNSMMTQAKMKIAQPEIDEIQEEIQATNDPNLQAELNNELMAVYKKYDIDMMGNMSGCLPLLIQMPIISAVYAAIRSSKNILTSTFLGIPLGEPSLLLTVLVVLVYLLQSWLSMKTMPQADNNQAAQTNKTMLLMNPLMFAWISYASAAGLALYFLAGGIFMVIQQAITNHVVKPRVERLITDEMEKYANQPKRKKKVRPNQATDGRIVPTKTQVKANKRRNEGRQQKRKK